MNVRYYCFTRNQETDWLETGILAICHYFLNENGLHKDLDDPSLTIEKFNLHLKPILRYIDRFSIPVKGVMLIQCTFSVCCYSTCCRAAALALCLAASLQWNSVGGATSHRREPTLRMSVCVLTCNTILILINISDIQMDHLLPSKAELLLQILDN